MSRTGRYVHVTVCSHVIDSESHPKNSRASPSKCLPECMASLEDSFLDAMFRSIDVQRLAKNVPSFSAIPSALAQSLTCKCLPIILWLPRPNTKDVRITVCLVDYNRISKSFPKMARKCRVLAVSAGPDNPVHYVDFMNCVLLAQKSVSLVFTGRS